MKTLSLLAILLCIHAQAQGNLLLNGDMELGANGDALPDHWEAAGDAETVTQWLTSADGRQGGHSARLRCTRLVKENPASHAMLCQMGHIGIEKGQW